MSKSGVLKSGWVIVNPTDTKVIDSNARAEQRLKEIAVKLAQEFGDDPEAADGFTGGIEAMQVSELAGDDDVNIIGTDNSDDAAQGSVMEAEQSSISKRADELIAEAQSQIELMKQGALVEIEEARQQAYDEAKEQGYQDGLEQGKQEGFEQGHQDGLDSVAQEREQAFAEAAQKIAMIEKEYQKKLDELEPRFIDTLTRIYEHIFHVSLKNSRELIVYLIQNTMRNIEGSGSYLIHVSKEDYPFASMQKRELIKNTNISADDVEIIEDSTMGKNECMIETGSGVFDCSLGTQLEALNEELRLLSYQP